MMATPNQIAEILKKHCRDQFGDKAVVEYDIQSMAKDIGYYCVLYNVELGLCLAQGIVESHWGMNPDAKRSRRTKNIFNVGNTDNGSDRGFATYSAGVERYCKLMDREYRWPADHGGEVRMITLAANDFQRPRGGRYASAPNYTQMVYAVYRKIMKELYPQGEPKPESQYKVGDWVKCKDLAGVPAQCKVLEIRKHNVILECTTGHIWLLPHNNIIRKLSPSEIIVTIGCLSGTIAKSCDPNYFLMLHSRPATDCNHSMIRFSAIDKETRSLVESLLKAQKEVQE
jgi:hypothetical protein